MKNKFIEIKGIGIPNKGAELMLIAVMQNIKNAFPGRKFCCEPVTDYEQRARYGLFQKTAFTLSDKAIDWSSVANLIPSKLRQKYGLAVSNEIDIIIDASGFAYGDQWGATKARLRMSKNIKSWKEQGKKVVLMPQAFGPFNNAELKKEIEVILRYADLVFARDKQSLGYLEQIAPGKAILAPDFTNLVSYPSLPEKYHQLANRPCLIPNHKMLTMLGNSDNYVSDMASVLNFLQEKNAKPFILIHEGVLDFELAQSIAAKLTRPIDIIDPQDALLIKSIISNSSFVISSRFHGLVSALSTGVPVIATGWSHKYFELLNDYGVSDFLIENNHGDYVSQGNFLIDRAGFLLDGNNFNVLKDRLNVSSRIEKDKTRIMWNKVISLLNA